MSIHNPSTYWNPQHDGVWQKSKPLILLGVACSVAITLPGFRNGVILPIDIVFALLIPVIASAAMTERFLRRLWLVALLWGVAQTVSDIVHGTQLLSAVALIGPSVALLVSGLWWLQRELRVRPATVVFAFACGWVILEALNMTPSNPWKYGISTPAAIAVISFMYIRGSSKTMVVIALLSLAAVSLYFDSRFLLGLFLFAAIAVGSLGRWQARQQRRSLAVPTLLLILLAGTAYLIYPAAASTGMLGARAYAQQAKWNSEGANFLLASRAELPQMATLVAKNPLLGIGAYGEIDAGEAYEALQFVDMHVVPLDVNSRAHLLNVSDGYLGYNPHSSALASALYAGVLALPFWLFFLGKCIQSVVGLVRGHSKMPGLLIFVTGLAMWDSLFSPLTAHTHISVAVAAFVVLSELYAEPAPGET